MLYIQEFKRVPDNLTDLLPWAALVSTGVVLNKEECWTPTFFQQETLGPNGWSYPTLPMKVA